MSQLDRLAQFWYHPTQGQRYGRSDHPKPWQAKERAFRAAIRRYLRGRRSPMKRDEHGCAINPARRLKRAAR